MFSNRRSRKNVSPVNITEDNYSTILFNYTDLLTETALTTVSGLTTSTQINPIETYDVSDTETLLFCQYGLIKLSYSSDIPTPSVVLNSATNYFVFCVQLRTKNEFYIGRYNTTNTTLEVLHYNYTTNTTTLAYSSIVSDGYISTTDTFKLSGYTGISTIGDTHLLLSQVEPTNGSQIRMLCYSINSGTKALTLTNSLITLSFTNPGSGSAIDSYKLPIVDFGNNHFGMIHAHSQSTNSYYNLINIVINSAGIISYTNNSGTYVNAFTNSKTFVDIFSLQRYYEQDSINFWALGIAANGECNYINFPLDGSGNPTLWTEDLNYPGMAAKLLPWYTTAPNEINTPSQGGFNSNMSNYSRLKYLPDKNILMRVKFNGRNSQDSGINTSVRALDTLFWVQSGHMIYNKTLSTGYRTNFTGITNVAGDSPSGYNNICGNYIICNAKYVISILRNSSTFAIITNKINYL